MGISKIIAKAMLCTGLFVAGYSLHSCNSEDARYDVRRYNNLPYLVDKKLDRKVQIVDSKGCMNLGDMEYRLFTLLNEEGLRDYVKSLEGKDVEKGIEIVLKHFMIEKVFVGKWLHCILL